MDHKYLYLAGFFWTNFEFWECSYRDSGTYTGTSMFVGVSNPMMVKGIIEDRIVKYKKIEEINQSIRKISDEFKMGRLDDSRYHALKDEYENELKKYN